MTEESVSLSERWRLWDQVGLRGPGFPVSGVLRLAPVGLGVAADKFGVGEVLSGVEWEGFEELFGVAAVGTAGVLQGIAGSGRFRAAVAWQNRAVLGSGVKPFLSWVPSVAGRSSMPRQREELVAHYWQRFCVKNDTIGFFGPVGWGRVDVSSRGVGVDPGVGLVSGSEVYFSSWSVDALARVIGGVAGVREWVAPRRIPFVGVVDGAVRVPGRPARTVSERELRVLELCDGVRSAHAIQRLLGPDTDVTEALDTLVRLRCVTWRLEVPADTRPELRLREILDRIGDPAVREPALAKLDVLERGRDRVRAAGDDPERLITALAGLEADFERLTEAAAQREKGATTAPCRALVYSDCVRSAQARIGGDIVTALAPLDLFMTSATWLTSRLAERVMRRAGEVFDRLAGTEDGGDGGDGTVDLASFWFACLPVLHGEGAADAVRLQEEFRRRWSDILSRHLPEGVRRVRVSGTEIAGQIEESFGGTGTGWTAARYLSPDVMVAAADTAALERGEFELVLGELHLATNTLGASLFVHQHPDPRELFARTSRDHPDPRLMPLLPKEHKSRLSARIRHSLVRPEDYHVALLDHTADPGRPNTVLSADARVERRADRLVVVLPDGTVFDAVDVFSHVLTTLVMDLFQILPESDRSPRVTVDSLVVARETWRFVASEMEFAGEKNEARRFVRARQWRSAQELPRWVFVVSPTEPRPFFVDFDSPVYVNIFAKAARRLARKDPAARMTVTEMLPNPEQAWLTDDEGNTYTSELRFVAVTD
ncbi:lantibiotic dehydratase [Streptomyces sp. NPDC056909]|uniref:lantibiotic dehydratase n=1 Tax=Streptomyces sp. NPDC056909 TaxID=3345963 RepID=UPI0036AE2CA2